MQFFSTLALALAATSAFASADRSLRTRQKVSESAVELLDAINDARAEYGRPPLCLSVSLSASSQTQADDMAAGGFISPVGSDGSMPTDRAQKKGFKTEGVYEVVGAGYKDASVAVDEWMKLADRDQYLLGDFKFLGAANTVNSAQLYKTFWVADFAPAAKGEKCAFI